MARLLSVNVGLPRDIMWNGCSVHTAIWKDPLPGRCHVGQLNVEGDRQGDLAGHGGEQRAVFVYQIESYRYWQEQLKRTDFVYGQFGENFTIEGLAADLTPRKKQLEIFQSNSREHPCATADHSYRNRRPPKHASNGTRGETEPKVNMTMSPAIGTLELLSAIANTSPFCNTPS